MMKCSKSVNSYKISSVIGNIFFKSCLSGIHEIFLDPNISDDNFSPQQRYEMLLHPDFCENEYELNASAKLCAKWLHQYFEDPSQLKGLQLPKLCPLDGESFRSKVWELLFTSVGVGETITYKELAMKLNNPGAVRAVGSAMRNNPISILVPCHRVVRKDGLGLYHGGKRQKVKEWLLQHEGVYLSEFKDRN